MARPIWLITSGGAERGGDEDDHDGVAAAARQLVRGDDADPAQQGQRHRQLEGDAEGEDQLHHQVEILADPGLELDRQLARAAPAVSKLRKKRHAIGNTK